jgi:hypothetical protein
VAAMRGERVVTEALGREQGSKGGVKEREEAYLLQAAELLLHLLELHLVCIILLEHARLHEEKGSKSGNNETEGRRGRKRRNTKEWVGKRADGEKIERIN